MKPVLGLRTTVALAVASALVLGVGVPSRAVANAQPSSEFESKRAQGLFETGLAKFDAGDYDGALEDLNGSLELEVTVKALYAKAQTLNKLDRCGEAVPIYNDVLEAVPEDSEAASLVKDALVECADKLAKGTGSPDPELEPEPVVDPVPDPDPQPEPKEDAWYKDIPAPIILGVGLVGVGVGGALLSQASNIDPAAADDYGAFEADRDRQRTLRISGGVVLGIGGALIVGGIVRYVVVAGRLRDEKASSTSVTPMWGPRSAGLSVQGRF